VHFKEAISIDPEFSNAYFGLGFSYEKEEAFQEAIQMYEKVLDLEPDDVETWLHLSLVLQKMGNIDDALDTLERAVILDKELVLLLDKEENLLEPLRKLKSFDEIMNKA
jgi:tetratricopeptide (TPR) repeat protein